MTGTRRRVEADGVRANEAFACELVDKVKIYLCAPSKLVVKEEVALIALQLNAEFLACDSVRDVALLSEIVFRHNPAVVRVIHNAIQEGDACVHILLDLGFHLTHSASACDAVCQAGIVATLVAVLPMLAAAPLLSALQLLDCVTDDDGDDGDEGQPSSSSSDRRVRRRLALQRLCRVACVRALWDVLAAAHPSSRILPSATIVALSLLRKITAAIETQAAVGHKPLAAAMQQVVTYTLQCMPPVETTLDAQMLPEDDTPGGDRRKVDPHVRAIIGELMARVQRWRGANATRSIQ